MQSELKLVFLIMYKEILQIAFIDELLDILRYEFVTKVYPTLFVENNVFHTLPNNFDKQFEIIWKKWELKTKELQGPKQMKKFS